MLYTVDILDRMKDKLGSYYKTAQALGVHPNRVNELRKRGGTLTDEQGLKAAEILGLPREAVILSLHAERALNSPAFDLLRSLAEDYTPKMMTATSGLALAILAIFDNLTQVPIA